MKNNENKTIWFDAATPKYSLFFTKLIPIFKKLNYKLLVTTRFSTDYSEARAILDHAGIDYYVVGAYGGSSSAEKLAARLKRQEEFLKIFANEGQPDALISGCVVDSSQIAFGLGIPIFQLSDTPVAADYFDYDKITVVSKLTLPLAKLVFYPFVIPSEVFVKIGVDPKNLVRHDFIDVCWWMSEIKKDEKKDFRKKYNLDLNKPTILVREEEYRAHYVKEQLPILYQVAEKLAAQDFANIVVMPRYAVNEVKERFAQTKIVVLEEKLAVDEFYPFINLLVGGGGTMNLEAACYGIPVISTRSLKLFHDTYLIQNGLMFWSDDVEILVAECRKQIQKKSDNRSFFCKPGASLNQIVEPIDRYLNKKC